MTERDLVGRTVMLCAIFEGTVVQLELARALERRGCRVVWTTTHRTWHAYLIREGVSAEDILDMRIPRDLDASEIDMDVLPTIAAHERELGLTLSMIVMMDRFLVDRKDPQIWRYLVRYYRVLTEFMQEHRVDMVLGEATNASDLMAYFAATTHGVPYYQLSSIRIPSDRVALFRGIREDDIVDHEGSLVAGDVPSASDVVAKQREGALKPIWFSRNNSVPIFRPGDVLGLVRNIYWAMREPKQSLTNFSIRTRVRDRFAQAARKRFVQARLRTLSPEDLPTPFALFALQVQPERSVDVFAPFATNQLELIAQVRRALPTDHALVVKEHSNLLGARGREFFDAVRALPNTYLVSPFADSHALVRASSLVLSVSSTINFEAALVGVPSIAFTPMYYNALSLSFACSDPRQLGTVINDALRACQDLEADVRFIQWLLQNSVEGEFGDATRVADMTSARNVDALTSLVATELSRLRPTAQPADAASR